MNILGLSRCNFISTAQHLFLLRLRTSDAIEPCAHHTLNSFSRAQNAVYRPGLPRAAAATVGPLSLTKSSIQTVYVKNIFMHMRNNILWYGGKLVVSNRVVRGVDKYEYCRNPAVV